MKKAIYLLVILNFFAISSCQEEHIELNGKAIEHAESSELNFKFLSSANEVNANHSENEEVIEQFLNHYLEVINRNSFDSFFSPELFLNSTIHPDLTKDEVSKLIEKGFSTLIHSDTELLAAFNNLEKNNISSNQILKSFYSKNKNTVLSSQEESLCIPNPDACGRALAVAMYCGALCPSCCLAEIGVEIHCCN